MNGTGRKMTIECILESGTFFSRETNYIEDFNSLSERLKIAQFNLRKIPINTLLNMFNSFSRALVKDNSVKEIEGIAFLSNWLRKSNLEKLINQNLGNLDVLNQFIGSGNKRVKAQPKGLVCHWIAGNIPTLSIFSLIQSMLVRNSNILRIPEQSIEATILLLKVFAKIEEVGIKGSDLLKAIAIVYYPSSDQIANASLSIVADIRVVWGGLTAVQAIQELNHREHCEDIIFGPKYSFSVLDNEILDSPDLEKFIRRFATDIVAFEQSACSSPHIFFIESNQTDEKFTKVINLFSQELSRLMKILPKEYINQVIATKIINKRAEYGLSIDKNIISSKSNDWTILIDNNIRLEEPIQSRTIWIKPVPSVMDIPSLITKNIQTIGCAFSNKDKFINFVDIATYKGVARCVAPGQMNIFDSPWDGIYFLQRLVNFVTVNLS